MLSIFGKAAKVDAGEITRLYTAVSADLHNKMINQWGIDQPGHAYVNQEIEAGHMYLLKRGEEILGAVVLNGAQDPDYRLGQWQYDSGKIGVLHRLCVHPEYQQRGYGKRILEICEDVLRREGCNACRLDVFRNNPYAMALFRYAGYREAGVLQARSGEFVLLEKSLQENGTPGNEGEHPGQ